MSFPTVPKGVTVRGTQSSPRGRSLIASQAFQAGDLIAIFGNGDKSPTVAIPDSPHLLTTCSGCLISSEFSSIGQSPPRLRACTGCGSVVYCSPACQKRDWTVVHKAECKLFKRIKASGHDFLPTPVRSLLHVLIRPDVAAAVEGLQGHEEDFRRAAGGPDSMGGGGGGGFWGDAELQAQAALHYLGRQANARSLGEAVGIVCKVQVNSFNRQDADVGQAGLFMDPALAMINHSCIPNAYVQFVGRRAFLFAYRDLKKDEDIEISYLGDCDTPLSARLKDLKAQYHFRCACPRCKDDLDVYQVCARYPHLSLNTLSLAPDLASSLPRPSLSPSLKATAEEIYPWCSAPQIDPQSQSPSLLSRTEKAKQLRHRWRACKPIVAAKAYALEPFPRVLTIAMAYFFDENPDGFEALTLALACFNALEVEPFKEPAPFAKARVILLTMIGKLVAELRERDESSSSGGGQVTGRASTAAAITSGQGKSNDVAARVISTVREKMEDAATVCQVLLELALQYAPDPRVQPAEEGNDATGDRDMGEWPVYSEARFLLKDIESLPGRETENALVRAFLRNPRGSEERRFFDQVVLGPIRELASLCLEIMDSEFGS